MTKAKQFEKAWLIAVKENNFVLVDEIYHPEYSSFDNNAGVEVNLEADKIAVSTIREMLVVGLSQILFEDNNFLCLQRLMVSKEAEIFASVITSITYKDGKIITQETVREELDYDPSEGQDWNWEDFYQKLGAEQENQMIPKKLI